MTTRPLSGSKADDGRFDLYVIMNGRSDWHDVERPGGRLK
jgi:hypothetical protein